MLQINFVRATLAFYGIITGIIGVYMRLNGREMQLIKAHRYYFSFVNVALALYSSNITTNADILSALVVTSHCSRRQRLARYTLSDMRVLCTRDMSSGPIVSGIKYINNDYPSEYS